MMQNIWLIFLILAASDEVFGVGILAPNVDDEGHPGLVNSQVSDDDVQKLVNCTTSQEYRNLSDIAFNPRRVAEGDMTCLSLQMFSETEFRSHFNISTNTLARFILRVQRGYRGLPYHSWSHGFAVLHFTFVILKHCQLVEKNYVTPLEGLALLTAGMSHDIDHPGTNNHFQEQINSSLAQKYVGQGSILERHHINVTLDILQNSATNFVSHLNEDDYREFEDTIRKIILATDLSAQLKLIPEVRAMAATGFDTTNQRNRELLLSTIISCADLSDQTRDWTTARRVARLVYSEFFAQGAQEKRLGLQPTVIMDSTKAIIPEQLVSFISQVVIPDFQVLQSLLPETQPCLDSLHENLQRWQRSVLYFQNQTRLGRDQMDVVLDSELDQMLA